MKISRAQFKDLTDILQLQKLAFQSEAEIYNNYNLPPIMEDLDSLIEDFENQIILKVESKDKIVGSVRAYEKDNSCHIERLIVHPDHQNRGIGTQLLLQVEKIFDQAHRFTLFTGSKSQKNLYLYEKLGYTTYKQEESQADMTLVFLEKIKK